MNAKQKIPVVLNYLIASVWLANGLFCKVLGLVPRHEQIVGRILGQTWAHPLTIAIGCSEIMVAVAVATRRYVKQVTFFQMAIIGTMNILEFTLAPDLLLHGKMNIVFAFSFIGFLYFYQKTYARSFSPDYVKLPHTKTLICSTGLV